MICTSWQHPLEEASDPLYSLYRQLEVPEQDALWSVETARDRYWKPRLILHSVLIDLDRSPWNVFRDCVVYVDCYAELGDITTELEECEGEGTPFFLSFCLLLFFFFFLFFSLCTSFKRVCAGLKLAASSIRLYGGCVVSELGECEPVVSRALCVTTLLAGCALRASPRLTRKVLVRFCAQESGCRTCSCKWDPLPFNGARTYRRGCRTCGLRRRAT